MSIPFKHVLEQGPVLAGLGRTALTALQQRLGKPSGSVPPLVPGPELSATLPPRSGELLRDYVRHVGGDPRSWRGEVPPHLFPQWSFGLAARTLTDLPYPIARVMNGGCRVEARGPLPAGKPIHVTAQLVEVDDNGRRAVLKQRITSGTDDQPEAIVAHLYAIVPLKRDPRGRKKEKARVPEDARELAFWRIGDGAGLDFAKLTGDFNPLHWVGPYARAAGFRNVILHGFSTMARAWEGLRRNRLRGARRITTFDVQFTRPLVLPARVGLYETDEHGVCVGDAPGGPAYMTGTYQTKETER